MRVTGQTKREQRSRPVVLVADDDPDVRLLARIQLADGFDVIQAANGRECVDLARRHAPDVILLDMVMPEMKGADVLAALAQQPATKDIPVIFLSALNGVEERVRVLENGATDYIVKPADGRELAARVSAAARTRARHEQLRAGAEGDPLTGLMRRKQFEARVVEESSRFARSRTPFSILLVDVDQMDELNDKLTAEVGDELLEEIAEALRRSLRTSDVLFRYGGDEFAVVLTDSDMGTAFLAAERLRSEIGSIAYRGVTVSVSIGVAEVAGTRTGEELIATAEIALFRAKESGGNLSWRADDPRRRSLNPVSLSEELTGREWDVLSLLAHKSTEQDIARRLAISAGTVRSHKARIRRKLHVSPEVRLAEFVKVNFRGLVDRMAPSSVKETQSS